MTLGNWWFKYLSSLPLELENSEKHVVSASVSQSSPARFASSLPRLVGIMVPPLLAAFPLCLASSLLYQCSLHLPNKLSAPKLLPGSALKRQAPRKHPLDTCVSDSKSVYPLELSRHQRVRGSCGRGGCPVFCQLQRKIFLWYIHLLTFILSYSVWGPSPSPYLTPSILCSSPAPGISSASRITWTLWFPPPA